MRKPALQVLKQSVERGHRQLTGWNEQGVIRLGFRVTQA
jgi:hypothetical protein